MPPAGADCETELSPSEIRTYCRERAPELKQTGAKEWRGPCPVHNGKDPNFAVDGETGRWFCHSQCGRGGDIFELEILLQKLDFKSARQSVLRIIGRASSENRNRSNRQIVAEYEYHDQAGNLIFQVVRFSPKGFAQRRPDGQGGWVWNLDGVNPVLYRLAKVLASDTVYVAEGEKDVATLEGWGLVATCNPMGAGKWRQEYAKYLGGKHVIILPDDDAPGRGHAADVADSAFGKAASVRVVEIPGAKDVTAWKEIGGTAEQLQTLIEAASPLDKAALSELRGRWKKVTGAGASGSKDRPQAEPSTPWPESIREEGYHGLAGDLVRLIEPHSESDPAGLLVQFLVTFGNCIGRGPYFNAEADRHGVNLYGALVGVTAKGRKGTSFGHVKRVVSEVDQDWAGNRVMSGLASGEGLIWQVRDQIEGRERIREGKNIRYVDVVVDPGVNDKRLLVVEPEFARVLQVTERESNTLSAIIRQGWDTGDLRILTKKQAAKATGAHISIVGHITRDELRRLLSDTAMANGFANRFLWICVRRSKLLPEGGTLHEVDFAPLLQRLSRAKQFASTVSEITRDEKARAIWAAVYGELSEGRLGLAGAVTSRAEAQTMRVAAIYALLDCSEFIRAEHLMAALEVWRYCEDSARFIFGDTLGDDTADEILRALRQNPAGLTRSDIREHSNWHKSSAEIGRALGVLLEHGLGWFDREEDTGGRPSERWFAVSSTARYAPKAPKATSN